MTAVLNIDQGIVGLDPAPPNKKKTLPAHSLWHQPMIVSTEYLLIAGRLKGVDNAVKLVEAFFYL